MFELTENSILQKITEIDPYDCVDLEFFCETTVELVYSLFNLEFSDINNSNLVKFDELHVKVFNALKNNKYLKFLGAGSFASTYQIPYSDKVFKINVASCDSVADSWYPFAKKIMDLNELNPWLPKIHSLYRQGYVYGAIIDLLNPIETHDMGFKQTLVKSIKEIIDSIEDKNFQAFKKEGRKVSVVLKNNNYNVNSEEILKALDFIIKVKKEEKAEYDISSQNIMFDQDNNIIINDPLSYSLNYSKKYL